MKNLYLPLLVLSSILPQLASASSCLMVSTLSTSEKVTDVRLETTSTAATFSHKRYSMQGRQGGVGFRNIMVTTLQSNACSDVATVKIFVDAKLIATVSANEITHKEDTASCFGGSLPSISVFPYETATVGGMDVDGTKVAFKLSTLSAKAEIGNCADLIKGLEAVGYRSGDMTHQPSF